MVFKVFITAKIINHWLSQLKGFITTLAPKHLLTTRIQTLWKLEYIRKNNSKKKYSVYCLYLIKSRLSPKGKKYKNYDIVKTVENFSGVRVTRSSALCAMFCRSLFGFLSIFFWPLCCLFFFELWILIIPLVSSNSSLPNFFLGKDWNAKRLRMKDDGR